jgi:hypothetical protein
VTAVAAAVVVVENVLLLLISFTFNTRPFPVPSDVCAFSVWTQITV